jgi:hypothetical protein
MFDNKLSNPHTPGTLVPPSSNPSDIHRDLKEAIQKRDTHNAKIIAQKASLIKIAAEKHLKNEISDVQRDEIIFMLNNCDYDFWRPVIYIIPNIIEPERVQTVPMSRRASFGPEYIISDLTPNDFDIIEV